MPVVARARCFVNDRPVISTARVTGQDRGVLGTIGISDLGPDQRRGRLLAGGRFCVSWSVPHNWVLTLHNRSEHVADGVLLISGQRRPRTNQLGGLIDGVVLSSGISAPLGELLVGQLSVLQVRLPDIGGKPPTTASFDSPARVGQDRPSVVAALWRATWCGSVYGQRTK